MLSVLPGLVARDNDYKNSPEQHCGRLPARFQPVKFEGASLIYQEKRKLKTSLKGIMLLLVLSGMHRSLG